MKFLALLLAIGLVRPRLVVDRIEGEYAVVERAIPGREPIYEVVPLADLPEGIREGDILTHR